MKEKDFGRELYELMKKHNIPMDSIHEMQKSLSHSIAKPIKGMLEAELDAYLGYEKHDQKTEKSNYRNGYSKKTIKGNFGEEEIEIPRDRNGQFEPQLIKKHEREISQIEEKVIFMYSKGLSTKDISDTIEELYGFGLSATTISKITDAVYKDIENFKNNPLDSTYPFVFIDGIRFKTRQEGMSKEVSIYLALGINVDGKKEILGFYSGESETSKQWLVVLNDLKTRGIENIFVISCDNLPGISDAIKAVYPQTKIQKCVIHQIRNSMKYVSSKDKKAFTSDMKLIYKASSYENAKSAFEEFKKKWNTPYPYAIKSWENNFEELTTFYDFPQEIRRVIYTTNLIENLNRSIRKPTKNKGSFPNVKALEKIVYLALRSSMKKFETSWMRDWATIMNQLAILFDFEL